MDKLVVSLLIAEAPVVPLTIAPLITEVQVVPLLIIEVPVVLLIEGGTLQTSW